MGLCENCKITMCRAKRDDVIGCAVFVAKDTNVLTNADLIRAMSDEELVEFVETIFGDCPWCHFPNGVEDVCPECRLCSDCILKWLKQPAEG